MATAFNRLPARVRYRIFEAQNRRKETPAEHLFRAYLASLGLPYQTQYGFLPEGRIVDFYLPDHNLMGSQTSLTRNLWTSG